MPCKWAHSTTDILHVGGNVYVEVYGMCMGGLPYNYMGPLLIYEEHEEHEEWTTL